ncbi:glutaredoxin domain-containing protein [Ruania alba]|uniref:Glutaredoxin n=1 Tax=Ruania alba TaxID=648782 RepID=A0A1H5BCA7_9MICO|nr:glutaredoxin domain-containing protein [Ruania alba]SED51977.1 Glutaredoxin [Ruania alba]
MRSRLVWLALLVVFAVIAWFVAEDTTWWWLVPQGAFILFYAWWSYPNRGATTTHAEVTALDEGDPRRRVIIYWRPGCMYCSRLRRRLGSARRSATWVNIWADDEAAAFVRSVNQGNETVPTVVLEGEAHTNPPPELVRDSLAAGLR